MRITNLLDLINKRIEQLESEIEKHFLELKKSQEKLELLNRIIASKRGGIIELERLQQEIEPKAESEA